MKLLRRLFLQRFSLADMIVFTSIIGCTYRFAQAGINIYALILFLMVTLIPWGAISIITEICLGLKPLNGFSSARDIDRPRY